jgi:hypothetical protein
MEQPPTETIHWRGEAVRALLIALIPMAVALGFLLTCDWFTLVDDDGLCQYQPLLSEGISRLLSGELPLWSHHSGCGYPLFARSLMSYPPHYVSHGIGRLLGVRAQEIAISHLLHLGAAAAAAYLYLRAIGTGRWPAAVAATAFGLAGPMLGMDTNWNEYAFLMPYLPLAFLAIEKIAAGSPSWFWTVLAGLIGSLVYVGTGMLGAFKYCMVFGLYFLLRCRRDTLAHSLTHLAMAALLAVLGCAAPLLAGKELLDWSTRLAPEGLTAAQGLGVMACAPEYFRGFFYPLVEFDWTTGNDWSSRFNGGALFCGPLAAFAVGLALVHVRRASGPERALLALVGIYFLLSLGWYFPGNYWLHPLPFFKQHRWPVRWTVEFCALAALLTGPALEESWRRRHSWASRLVVLVFLTLVFAAILVRTPHATEWENAWRPVGIIWAVVVAVLMGCFYCGWERTFYVLALAATVAALAVNVPGTQRQRWASLRQLLNDPIELADDTPERVLYLANRDEQRGPPGEGNFSYDFPHRFGNRTVLTYGPFQLMTQVWQAGINSQGEIEDENAVVRAFLQGHALETLRVGRVVVARDNARLNEACRSHPHLRFEAHTHWKTIYRHEGPRAPVFFVQELQPESMIDSTETIGRADLTRVGFIQDNFPGPRAFAGAGQINDFREIHGSLRFQTETTAEELAVITTTWYPGWQATLDGRPLPLYRVNGSFMAVQVPAGRHEIQLRFWPARLVYLAGLNIVCLASMFAFCAVAAFRLSDCTRRGFSL